MDERVAEPPALVSTAVAFLEAVGRTDAELERALEAPEAAERETEDPAWATDEEPPATGVAVAPPAAEEASPAAEDSAPAAAELASAGVSVAEGAASDELSPDAAASSLGGPVASPSGAQIRSLPMEIMAAAAGSAATIQAMHFVTISLLAGWGQLHAKHPLTSQSFLHSAPAVASLAIMNVSQASR